jgi:D-tyrosyl-tRNA(Tyr) deacylase
MVLISMRALIQRVSRARVSVGAESAGEIGKGLVILLGVKRGDSDADARRLADKCANLRVFEDDGGRMNRSVIETGGSVLVVSQFTLYGDCRHGRRPGFTGAAAPGEANRLYEIFVRAMKAEGLNVQTGVFKAMMEVEIHNDGPVTLMVEAP